MKILHVIRTLDPRTGGPATVVRGLAAAQVQAGHRVTVLFEDPAAQGVLPLEDIQLINLGLRPMAEQGLEGAIEHLRPDVLHLHGVWCRIVRRAGRLARKRGLPYVIAPHGALGRWSLAQGAWKKRLALLLLLRPLLRGARALVASNRSERQDLLALGFGESAVLVPHGLAPAEMELAAVPRSMQPTVLFLGRLTQQKDPILLLEAFELLAARQPEVRLVVAGPDGGIEALVHARIELFSADLGGRVELVGPLFEERKRAALRSAWVLCLPSRYESFGLVLIEALAQETPVVCSEECSFPELDEAKAGVSVPRDPEALARELAVYLDPERRRAAGSRGRALVQERYLWARQVEQYAKLYRGERGRLD